MEKICIGIDIAKESFVTALPCDSKKKFKTEKHAYKSPSDIAKFISTLDKDKHICVMEATGVYHKRLAYALYDANIPVCVVNPASIKFHTRMKNSITKTDEKDAKDIAIYGAEQKPVLYEKPTEVQDGFAQKRALLSILQKQVQMLKNQLESVSHQPQQDKYVADILKKQIATLEKQIEDVKEKMKGIVKNDFSEDYKLLLSVPAIGDAVATELIDALSTFSCTEEKNASKAFCKFVGLVPCISESGTSVRKSQHITRSSVPTLRSKIYIATCATINHSSPETKNPIRDTFNRLREKGKTYKQALVAAMHKVVRIAFAVLINRVPFDPNFISTK